MPPYKLFLRLCLTHCVTAADGLEGHLWASGVELNYTNVTFFIAVFKNFVTFLTFFYLHLNIFYIYGTPVT